MNKSTLKRFATQTRLELIEIVSTKLGYLLSLEETALPVEYRDHSENIRKMKERCSLKGAIDKEKKEEFIEEVGYTWFNRLVALRFMDANEITELGVISPLADQTLPAIYNKAKEGTIDKELKLERDKFFSLIDGKIAAANPDNEAYRMLFVAVCNLYSTLMPFIFEAISDYTELLLPDDMLSANSVRAKVVEAMPEEDCNDVEIIGWLYQFYIAHKKDDVFAALKKNKKITPSNIPAATQLFTPDWIVKYMVENSLGKLWLLNNPSSSLKSQMKYYIENPDESSEFIKINSPEEITLLDPCMGSGHILTYAFDLLTKIYEEAGYNSSDISTLILEKNLYGCDIDKRAATLAQFALTMKARMYYRRFFRKTVRLNVVELQDFGSEEFAGIKNFGSLMTPQSNSDQFDEGIFGQNTAEYELQKGLLSSQFHCVVTNPPYMGGKGMNKELSEFVKKRYPNSKSDLFAVFIERGLNLTVEYGFMAMISMSSWMFLSGYEKLRKSLLKNHTFDSLLNMGWHAFGNPSYPSVAFILNKSIFYSNNGTYIGLDNYRTMEEKKVGFFIEENYYYVNQSNFSKIPGSPIAYWVSKSFIDIFNQGKGIKDDYKPCTGLQTGDNDYFTRRWHEVEISKSNISTGEKWIKLNNGGEVRRWYGNQDTVVNWENNGNDIKRSKTDRLLKGEITANNSKCWNEGFYFKEGITWSNITAKGLTVRYLPENFIFDKAGDSLFFNQNSLLYKYYLLSFFNSIVALKIMHIVAPTLNLTSGSISNFPIVYPNLESTKQIIDTLTRQNVDISKEEWDSRETSWDFMKNELIKHKSDRKIKTAYSNFCNYWKEHHDALHQNEEELNRLFIDIYELQDELTSKVELEDITILKKETTIIDDELVFQADEIIKQFVSYGVGVMFGRYSLDQEGLIIANMGQEILTGTTFEIDDDNIIPILEDDYFTDDIASRFIEFAKVAFGEEHHAENIQFIEDALGTTIRKYFVKGFYDDHIKRYKKRPIYWMVSSPKKSFNALIYMHRYQDDIFARIQNNYLREYITKLEAASHTATTIAKDESNSAADRRQATKDIESIAKKIEELIKFDRDKLTPFAQSRTSIDLDDGVKVNYSKFEDILYPIPGLLE